MSRKFKQDDWVKVIASDKKAQVIEYIKDVGVSIASAMGQHAPSRDDFYTNQVKCRTYGESSGVKIFTEDELDLIVPVA